MTVTSAQRKLARGIEQAKVLCGEAETFQHARAYTLRTERDVQTPQHVEYRCFAIEHDRLPEDLTLRVGEAIHNLRASLDHVITAASSRPTRRTQFPVFTDACEFQVKSPPMIPRLPPAVRAIVKAAQPFNTMPKHPKIEPLFILNDLWNQDKHRNLSTIAAAVEVPFIAYTGDVDVRITEFAGSDIELHQDTKVVTFTIDGPKAEEMEVDPHFTYQVRREGRPFVETIRSIARTAYRLVNECETGQPTPLLSFSPI